MSDSNNLLDQLSTGQGNLPTRINELLDAVSPPSVYGRRAASCVGLTWGYYGGRWGGIAVSAFTLTLTPSANNYLVVNRSTGVISTSTSTTNWNDATNYGRVYLVVTGPGTVTSYQDHRAGPLSIFWPAA